MRALSVATRGPWHEFVARRKNARHLNQALNHEKQKNCKRLPLSNT